MEESGEIQWSIDKPSSVSISLLTKFDTLDDQSVLIHSDGLEEPNLYSKLAAPVGDDFVF